MGVGDLSCFPTYYFYDPLTNVWLYGGIDHTRNKITTTFIVFIARCASAKMDMPKGVPFLGIYNFLDYCVITLSQVTVCC